jgi:hypothetical protein
LAKHAAGIPSEPAVVPRARARWIKTYRVEISIVLAGLLATNAIFIARAFRQTTTVSPEAAGQLGEFVGGYVGASFALISVVMLYRTLREQMRASELEGFQNKYFQLIRMHRDNVSEIELKGESGRRVFVLLIRELRSALQVIKKLPAARHHALSLQRELEIAYYVLFFGVGPNSSRMLKASLLDSNFDPELVDAVEREFNNPETKGRVRDERDFGYVPFEGHQSRLGHYYRHLYQMVTYVDEQTLDIDKYHYVKTMRAQLSTHEQALLLINSRTPIGRKWWDKARGKEQTLIAEYRLVKNIPSGFFDASAELDTSALFGPKYFEWQEVRRDKQ